MEIPLLPVEAISLLGRNCEFIMASATSEKIFVASAAANRDQSGSRFVFDPTTGALIVSPDLDLKICNAFTREVCRMKLRLYRGLAGLYLSKFALQSKDAVLCIARKFERYLLDLGRDGHGQLPTTINLCHQRTFVPPMAKQS
jgi:hypothetical protein